MNRKYLPAAISYVTILLITAFTFFAITGTARAGQLCTGKEAHTGTADRITAQMTISLKDGRTLRLANIEFVQPLDLLELNHWLSDKQLEFFSPDRVKDRHNNILAQVFINSPERIWLQEYFIKNGSALASALPTVKECYQSLVELEQTVRKNMSANGTEFEKTHFIDAEELDRLKQLPQGSFQIIEGRVKSVGQSTRNIFLNFSENWKEDFTVLIEKRLTKRKHHNWPNLKSLAAKKIRVRGWLDYWNGPMIRLHTPEMLEIIDAE